MEWWDNLYLNEGQDSVVRYRVVWNLHMILNRLCHPGALRAAPPFVTAYIYIWAPARWATRVLLVRDFSS